MSLFSGSLASQIRSGLGLKSCTTSVVERAKLPDPMDASVVEVAKLPDPGDAPLALHTGLSGDRPSGIVKHTGPPDSRELPLSATRLFNPPLPTQEPP